MKTAAPMTTDEQQRIEALRAAVSIWGVDKRDFVNPADGVVRLAGEFLAFLTDDLDGARDEFRAKWGRMPTLEELSERRIAKAQGEHYTPAGSSANLTGRLR